MINELHKRTLEALGFEAMSIEHPETDEYLGGLWWALVYRESEYVAPDEKIEFQSGNIDNYHSEDEADAWAQAPSLEQLALSLMTALGELGAIMTETASDIPVIQVSLMMPTPLNGRIVWDYGDCQGVGATYQEAIAALFVAACDAGLIDGKAVVL